MRRRLTSRQTHANTVNQRATHQTNKQTRSTTIKVWCAIFNTRSATNLQHWTTTQSTISIVKRPQTIGAPSRIQDKTHKRRNLNNQEIGAPSHGPTLNHKRRNLINQTQKEKDWCAIFNARSATNPTLLQHKWHKCNQNTLSTHHIFLYIYRADSKFADVSKHGPRNKPCFASTTIVHDDPRKAGVCRVESALDHVELTLN